MLLGYICINLHPEDQASHISSSFLGRNLPAMGINIP